MLVLFEDKVEITSNCKPSTYEYRGWAFMGFKWGWPLLVIHRNGRYVTKFRLLGLVFQYFQSEKSTLQYMGIKYSDPYMERINSPMTRKEFLDTLKVGAVVLAVLLLIIITAP